jgi:hypothetical protein
MCFLISGFAYAECDLEPIKKDIKKQYETVMPVQNEKGEIGRAKAKNFVISDYLMKVKDESFLIANFELDIKWLKGNKQTVKTLVVANINEASCEIETFENGDTFGSSMTAKK